MRVLVVHNRYQQHGGEDSVVQSEVDLLRKHGHDVELYQRSNDEIGHMSSLAAARDTFWSRTTQHQLTPLLRRFQPELVHCHNTFPLISPSVYWTTMAARIPTVQTLHNFRLMCLNALFLREQKVCEDCKGHAPWRGVVRRCYRGSLPASAALASMLLLHRSLGTFDTKVTRYIALNDFCRRKFIEGGLPADRISIKPNFASIDAPSTARREGIAFVGRLAIEKGLDTLLQVMRRLGDLRLTVAGTGPQAGLLQGLPNVAPLGHQSGTEVRALMAGAAVLVVPSICYEAFGLVAIEAFACATPVVASRIGALADLVQDGVTGLLFEPGNAADLEAKLRWAVSNPEQMRQMGKKARQQYEQRYAPERNHGMLMDIYALAMREFAERQRT